MCYGGCDCQRCSGEPPTLKKNDRQQCSDDWGELTSHTPKVIFEKDYIGFESLYDWERDLLETLQLDLNPKAYMVQGKFRGTMRVVVTYIPENT